MTCFPLKVLFPAELRLPRGTRRPTERLDEAHPPPATVRLHIASRIRPRFSPPLHVPEAFCNLPITNIRASR